MLLDTQVGRENEYPNCAVKMKGVVLFSANDLKVTTIVTVTMFVQILFMLSVRR